MHAYFKGHCLLYTQIFMSMKLTMMKLMFNNIMVVFLLNHDHHDELII